MINFLVQPKVQFFDNNGDPLSGGLVFVYSPGTSTKTNSYQTLADAIALTNANTNPVVLNSRGEANIVVNRAVKIVVTASTDTDPPTSPIITVDNWSVISSTFTGDLGNKVLTLSDTASAVNYVNLANATTGNYPIYSAAGSDTDISLGFQTKGAGFFKFIKTGTGDVRFDAIQSSNGAFVGYGVASTSINLLADQPIKDSSGNNYLAFSKTASAVNYATITNSATGNPIRFSAAGSDTNVDIDYYSKGTGAHNFIGGASSIQRWYSNTDLTHSVAHNISAATAARTITWPDSNVTILAGAAAASDQETATSTTLAVTPAVQQRHPSAAKAWLYYTSVSTTSSLASYNVSSLTDGGTGLTTVNFTTAFSSANYAVCSGLATGNSLTSIETGTLSTGSTVLRQVASGSLADGVSYASWFGDQ